MFLYITVKTIVMRTFELFVDDIDLESQQIALVESPAIDVNFMAFSKDEENKQIFHFNEEKHIVTGPVLIPDKRIYRYSNGMEYYVYFGQETIEKVAHEFLSNINRFNIEHEKEVEGVKIIESWVKSDLEFDKSTALDMPLLPVGTWLISVKIDNEEVWKQVKNGTFQGFSIQGTFVLEEREK